MNKTMMNIQPVKPASEKHNTRQVDLDYVRKDLSPKNESIILQQDSISKRTKQRKLEVKKLTGRTMQAKAAPIRDGVFLIKEDTTMKECEVLAKEISETFKIEVMQIYLHKDEGHYDKTKKWIPNLHGHMIFDFMDSETGLSVKLSSDEYSQLQTMVAESLGMERGKSSDKKHMKALQYKIEQIEKDLQKAKEEVQGLKEEREQLLDQQIQQIQDVRRLHEQEYEIQRMKMQAMKNSFNKELLKLRTLDDDINKIKTDAGNIFNELSQKNITNATELNEAMKLHRALIDKKNESGEIYKNLAEKEKIRKSKDFGVGD